MATEPLNMRDIEKLKRLIHYVAWKAGKRDWFGATKLYKVLWFADARQFVLTKKPITDAIYIREKYGPVPKDAMIARRELEREKAIRVSKDGKLTRIVALSKPDTSIFSPDELAAVNYWIEHIDKEHTAQSISDKSHDYAWDIAKMGEELPLFAVLANRIREPNERELEKVTRESEGAQVGVALGALTVVLDEGARKSLVSAIDKWSDAERAWEAIEWALARDPFVGVPFTESGNVRGFVYDGARSIDQPDVEVVYEITKDEIIVRSAEFCDAKATQAGRA